MSHKAEDVRRQGAQREPVPDPDGLFAVTQSELRERRSRARRWTAWALALVVGVLLGVLALTPAVLSSGFVRRVVVDRANAAQQDAVLEIGDWTWHWRSPCRIDGVTIRTRDQRAVLQIPSISFSKGLAAWIGRRQRFGTITIDRPEWRILETPPSGTPVPGSAADGLARSSAQNAAASRVDPAGKESRRIGLPLQPFGSIIVRQGRGEAFPVEGPAIRFSAITIILNLEGLDGPVSLRADGEVPRRQDADPGVSGTFSLEARASVLRDILLDPAAAPFEVRTTVPPVDLSALEAFLPPDASRPKLQAGRAEAELTVRRGGEAALAIEGWLALRGLQLAGGALGTDRVQWDAARLSVDAELHKDALSVRAFAVECPWGSVHAAGTLDGTGRAGLRGDGVLTAEGRVDLAALAAQLPATLRLRPDVVVQSGALRFDAEAVANAKGRRVFGMVRCDGLKTARAGEPLGTDIPFTLGWHALLDPSGTSLTLRSFRLAAGPLTVAGQGSMTDLNGERRLVLDGVSTVEWDAVGKILEQRGIDDVTLAGRSERAFQVALPLGGGRRYLLGTVELEGGLQAQKVEGFGMLAQDAVLALHAARGELRISAQTRLNEGELRLEPHVDLLSQPPLLTLSERARVLADARLTDELLDRLLARVHPVLKGCGVSGGWMSLDLEQCAIPLAPNAAQTMSWTAALQLREVRLTAAGPLDQLAAALRLKRREVTLTNQTQTVVCRDGRLHPQPLALSVDGHPLRVSGSVGLDGSLDYVVEVALTRELVGDQAYRLLEGQTVRIPLTGTAAKPMLETRALEAEVRRIVAASAVRAAASEIHKTGAP